VNRSKQKGTAFESALVDYLRANGFPRAERRAQRGTLDAGDIAGLPATIEAKNCKLTELGPWMDEAKTEAKNAGTALYAVVHKRRQHSTAESFVTLPLHLFVEMLVYVDAP